MSFSLRRFAEVSLRARVPMLFGVAAALLLAGSLMRAQIPPTTGQFLLQFGSSGVTSLKYVGDKFDTDYIADESTLGQVRVRYKMGENDWSDFSTDDSRNKVQRLPDARSPKALQQLALVYNPQSWLKNEYYADLELTERFRVEANAFY